MRLLVIALLANLTQLPPVLPAQPAASSPCSALPPGPGRLQACQRAVRTNPNDMAARLRYGRQLVESGRAKEAVRVLRDGVRRAPNDPSGQFALGEAYDATGNSAGALAAYERHAELEPENARAHLLVGWLRLERNQPVLALESFRAAVVLQPGHADGHHGTDRR